MIVIFHSNGRVSEIVDHKSGAIITANATKIAHCLIEIATRFHDRLVVWCDEECSADANFPLFGTLFDNPRIMASFSRGSDYLPEAIGYVDENLFLNVKESVRYPTWRMSSVIGGIHAEAINRIASQISPEDDFDYFLHSVAKLAMPLGLYCFSEPRLLIDDSKVKSPKPSYATFLRFVKQHYTFKNFVMLLVNLVMRERIFPMSAFGAVFYRRRHLRADTLSDIPVKTTSRNKATTLDVIIPTIGRKQVLFDTLVDFSNQTKLPNRVIVVEQNPLPDSVSELDYLQTKEWPFEIVPIFVRTPGACNARNLALEKVSSDWVFFADDDIRIGTTFFADMFDVIAQGENHVFNICCLTEGQQKPTTILHQTSVFGSGCSIVSRESIGNLKFDRAFEHGFGEDNDFGAKLTDRGFPIYYVPSPMILHLKAPMGGFRTKVAKAWENDQVKPKPSPTIMLFHLSHQSKQQFAGYQTRFFLKSYSKRGWFPLANFRKFKKQWNSSVYWANKLRNDA